MRGIFFVNTPQTKIRPRRRTDFRLYYLIFLLSRFKISFRVGVLYLSASVGNTFRYRLTIATGSAIVRPYGAFNVSIAKKPMGYESLCVRTPLLHSMMNFSIYSGLEGCFSSFLLKPPSPPSSQTLSFQSLTRSFLYRFLSDFVTL